MLTVQKFGGSSVADAGKIARAAGIIAGEHNKGSELVVVLSAQGDATDELTEKALEINPDPPKRELDALLSAGEQISVSLMAMQLEKMGLPAVSLTGWQMGLLTDAEHGAARIRAVSTERIRAELDRGRIVIAAGFQGVDKSGDITTLGRGGSDTTAAALAAALHADKCQIYTDVEGVFTADPRKVPGAYRLEEIGYDEMLELSSLGSQVLHNRSVELARRGGVELEVLSSCVARPGTTVTDSAAGAEGGGICGVAADYGAALVRVGPLNGGFDAAGRVFDELGRAKISADMISVSPGGGACSVSFTVAGGDADAARQALEAAGLGRVCIDRRTAKVSVVGAGLPGSPGVAARLLGALCERGISVLAVSTGELKISVLVPAEQADIAAAAIHEKFFGLAARGQDFGLRAE